MHRNQRREAHEAKRSQGLELEEDAQLAPEWVADTERAERFHHENDRRSMDLQVQANMRDPLTRRAYQ